MSVPTGLKVALALNAGAVLAVAALAVHLGGGFAPASFPPDEPLPRAAAPLAAPALTPAVAGPADDAGSVGADTPPPYPSFATPDLSARPWLTRADGSVRLRD